MWAYGAGCEVVKQCNFCTLQNEAGGMTIQRDGRWRESWLLEERLLDAPGRVKPPPIQKARPFTPPDSKDRREEREGVRAEHAEHTAAHHTTANPGLIVVPPHDSSIDRRS